MIEEKHLRRFRTLLRQLGDLPLSRDTTFAGLLHMGEEGNEIWVEAGLPEPEKRFTIIHELVHARRQRSSEDLVDDALEEAIVELESVARVGKRILKRMPSGVVLSILHDYLTGRGRNCEAIGARVKLVSGDLVQWDEVRAGDSYLSSSDKRLHFGLGRRGKVDLVEIHWPDGQIESLRGPGVNQFVFVEEGRGMTRVMPPRR